MNLNSTGFHFKLFVKYLFGTIFCIFQNIFNNKLLLLIAEKRFFRHKFMSQIFEKKNSF